MERISLAEMFSDSRLLSFQPHLKKSILTSDFGRPGNFFTFTEAYNAFYARTNISAECFIMTWLRGLMTFDERDYEGPLLPPTDLPRVAITQNHHSGLVRQFIVSSPTTVLRTAMIHVLINHHDISTIDDLFNWFQMIGIQSLDDLQIITETEWVNLTFDTLCLEHAIMMGRLHTSMRL